MLRRFIKQSNSWFRTSFIILAILALPLSGIVRVNALFGNDYPWPNNDMSVYSPLGFAYRNCTDWAAWRLNVSRGGSVNDIKFNWGSLAFPNGNGNASGWKDGATNSGYTVNSTPVLGSVAWWGASPSNSFGHVAIVGSVSSDSKTITVEEYNKNWDGKYGTRSLTSGSADWPQSFLHIADSSNMKTSDNLSMADWNGDGKPDISIFRPSDSTWRRLGMPNIQYGTNGDIPVPADWNGDGKTDAAVFRPSNGTWYRQGMANVQFGTQGDKPVMADWNGDGKPDISIFRPSDSTWRRLGMPNIQYGTNGDIPVPADWNGDGKTDAAVFRPSNGTWYRQGMANVQFGTQGDKPVMADWNGDGKPDISIFRPSDSTWRRLGMPNIQYGTNGDIPVPADWNGDGKTDAAVFRPSNGTWYRQGMANVQFGTQGDKPLANSW